MTPPACLLHPGSPGGQSVRGAAEHHHCPVIWPISGGELCPYLDKHLAARGVVARRGGSAVHGHGLAVPGELQGALLPHQLLDHLQEQHWAEPGALGCPLPWLTALLSPQDGRRKAPTGARKDGTGIKAYKLSLSERSQEIYYNLHRPIRGKKMVEQRALCASKDIIRSKVEEIQTQNKVYFHPRG